MNTHKDKGKKIKPGDRVFFLNGYGKKSWFDCGWGILLRKKEYHFWQGKNKIKAPYLVYWQYGSDSMWDFEVLACETVRRRPRKGEN